MTPFKSRVNKMMNNQNQNDSLFQSSNNNYLDLENSKSFVGFHFINNLHRAIYEGDMDVICNYIDGFREKRGASPLNDSERAAVGDFYNYYLTQHPPDGILRMAQFLSAALDRFS